MKHNNVTFKDTPVVVAKMENGAAAVKGLWTLDKTAFALGISPDTLLVLANNDAPDGPFDLIPFPGDEGFDPDQVDDWLEQCHTRIRVLRQLEAHMWKMAAQHQKSDAGGPSLVKYRSQKGAAERVRPITAHQKPARRLDEHTSVSLPDESATLA